MQFKDEESLQAKKARFAEVLEIVAAADAEIAARRAASSNKYIERDRKRFGGGSNVEDEIIRREAAPKSEHYIVIGKNEFRAVEGKDVDVVDWLETFIWKSGKEWVVTEKTTGLRIFGAGTQKGAIAGANERLEVSGEEKTRKSIADAIEKSGGTPYYRGRFEQASFEEPTETLNKISLKALLGEFAGKLKGIAVEERNGTLQIRTRGGNVVQVYQAEMISVDEIVLRVGYGRSDTTGGRISGKFTRQGDKREITLRRDAAGLWTLSHEFVHFLESIGAITSEEQSVLDKKIAWLIKRDPENYGFLAKRSAAERRAEYLGRALSGAYDATTVTGKIIQKIKDIIDAVLNAFGVRTAAGVIRDIRAGKVYDHSPGNEQSAVPSDAYAMGQRLRESDVPIDDVAPAELDVKGSNKDILTRVAEEYRSWPEKIIAADGSEILLANPEDGYISKRALHLVWDNEKDVIKIDKARWLPNVPTTLSGAAVRLADHKTGNRVFVKAYSDGTRHMVVVAPDGIVVEQKPFTGKLVTQFPSTSGGRREGMIVDWERNGEGRSQGVPNPTSPASTSPGSRQGTFREEILHPGKTDVKKQYSFEEDLPKSKDPKALNLYLKDETDAFVQTMMNKLQPKHMTWLETMLKSPEWFDHPQIQAITRIFMRDRNEIYHETFNDLNLADDMDTEEQTVSEAAKALKNKGLSLADRLAGKVSPEYQRLQEILDEGDTSWKRNTSIPLEQQIAKFEEHVRRQGATEDTIRVWRLYRQSYDKALDLMTAQLRRMIEEITEEAHFRGEKPDLAELSQTLRGALAQMKQWKGFYAPRLREMGNWKVQAYKEHGPMKENREWYREHKGSELSARRLAQKLQREGWKIHAVGEVERLPESVYQDVKSVATAKLIDSALEKMSKKSALGDKAMKLNEEVLRAVSDEIKARGFRSTMIHRGRGNVVRGFIEDPIQRHLQYINNVSGGIAKARSAKMAMKELHGEIVMGKQVGGIDPVKDPEAYRVATNYIEEQLRNAEPIDRMIGLAKSIATFKFLGFNLRSLAVNTTAIITTAPAAIHQYALGGKGSLLGIIKELGVAGKDYGAYMAGKDPADKWEQAFLNEVTKLGWDDAQYTREALGEISKTHSRVWSTAMDYSMYLFGKSEQWNRGTTMLAAYRLARKQGMNHIQASEAAKNASDKAHGIYGKATMPMWAMGNNPAAKIGQMFYVYQKFGHNYLQMLYDMGAKKKNN